jgi:recombinational DNA repair protein (RecF pathway)
MAHCRYHTEGLVVGHIAQGEANRLYQVLTPDFGLIRVHAQGVRLEKSKLRYNLQNYHFADIDLVRGREYWRLVGAEKITSANLTQTNFCRKISSVLLRLIHGEEANRFIFSDLSQAWELLASEPSNLKLEDLEIFILVRLLFNLGYLALSPLTSPLVSLEEFSLQDIFAIADKRVSLIKVINSSLNSSGL